MRRWSIPVTFWHQDDHQEHWADVSAATSIARQSGARILEVEHFEASVTFRWSTFKQWGHTCRNRPANLIVRACMKVGLPRVVEVLVNLLVDPLRVMGVFAAVLRLAC